MLLGERNERDRQLRFGKKTQKFHAQKAREACEEAAQLVIHLRSHSFLLRQGYEEIAVISA